MTVLMPERPTLDRAALKDQLRALLASHGIPTGDLRVDLVTQGGLLAGVTVSTFERPAELAPPMTREEYEAYLVESGTRVFAELAERFRSERGQDDEQGREAAS